LSELLERLLILERERPETRADWGESTLVPDENDFVRLISQAHQSAAFHRRHLRDSYSAEPGDAVRDEDEQNPGKYKIVFRSRDGGERTYRGLPREVCIAASSRGLLTLPNDLSSASDLTEDAPPADWMVLRDETASPAVRVTALGRLLNTPHHEDALTYLVSELGRSDVQPDWRDATVFAAEDIHFPPELRAMVGDRLLAIASALRFEAEARDKVVWSALRRGASLLAPQQVQRLLPFLQGGPVDTRAVALQAVCRIFESQPADSPNSSVADRAYQFTTKFLDPDVFTPGEPSLVARYAVSALAVLVDPRLQQALENVTLLNRGFLTRRLRQELQRIRSGWLDRGVPYDHPAFKNIDEGLARLEPLARSSRPSPAQPILFRDPGEASPPNN
jgi:hypothetical protein